MATEDEIIKEILASAISDFYKAVEVSTTTALRLMPPPPMPPEEARLSVMIGIIKETPGDLVEVIIHRLKVKGYAIGAFE